MVIIKRTKRSVDVLSLSATPIPRTLYMCETGIRAISLLTTPPEGRLPVATTVSERCDAQILSAVSAELGRGGQVLVVVPVALVGPPRDRGEASEQGLLRFRETAWPPHTLL